MKTTKSLRPRGRPRQFDPDDAVATAQRLFHERGYDAVSVADLTAALGIRPPSFYAAFGSKAGLYDRVLERYNATGAIPLAELLDPERPVADGLAAVLESAARLYATDPDAAGCLVLEGTRCNDAEARAAAKRRQAAAEDILRAYVGARHPRKADLITDFMGVTMTGMSAKARKGHGLERLLQTARLASLAIVEALRD